MAGLGDFLSGPMDLFNHLMSQVGVVNGGTASPQGNQASQPQQPSTVPSAGVAQAGGAQGQAQAPNQIPQPDMQAELAKNPMLASLMQPPSTMDQILKFALPAIAGLGAETQLSAEAGPWHRIGAALGGGANTFLQMRQNDAQNNLAKAQLFNTMRHESIGEQQKQQEIGVSKQQADFATKGFGSDITENLRGKNPMLDASLPSKDFMAKLPMAEQGKFLTSAVTLADTKAKLEETKVQHQASNDLKSQALTQHADAVNQMAQLRQEAITNQLTESQGRMDLIKQQIEDRKAAGQDTKELKQQQLELQKQTLDLKTQLGETKKDSDNANRLIKARQNYDAHWHLTTNWEDYAKSVGIDPDSGASVGKGDKGSSTSTTIKLPD